MEIAALLQRNDPDAVAARFAPGLASALPGWRFHQGWDQILERTGKLESVGTPTVSKAGSLETLVLPAKFERADWLMTMAFDGQGRLTTLRFAPASLTGGTGTPAWGAAAYANPTKFRESEVKVGAEPWILSGTLTLPVGNGPFPAVVLVHGSGPNDRDETVGGTKVFKDLAWGLATSGVAVLRFEKRSKVYGAKMDALPITVKEEVVDDAVAAVRLLRATDRIDRGRIAVLGHSLGGTLAPRIAAASGGEVAGVISLAGPTRPIHALVEDQADHLVAAGAAKEEDVAKLRAEARKVRDLDASKAAPDAKILGAPVAYWVDYASYDPGATARKTAIPILVLQGGRDYQVTAKDLEGWRKALDGASFAKFQTFPNANHLFVNGQGKSLPTEYLQPGNVAGEVVELIAKWVKALPARK
jgi:dienelactone hydrolase